jgi:uncharacterized caspase-like protein
MCLDFTGGLVSLQIRVLAAVFAFLSFFAIAATSAQAQDPGAAQNPRIALVIGNSAYPDHPLATPANDAGLVAQTLQAAGFEVVGARDLDQNTLRGALRDFLAKAAAIGPDMQAFVYMSGRGLQFEGDNYFVPVDAQIARDADVPIQAIKISDFSRALAATPGRARIIVMDAARANSFAADGSPLAGGLGLVDPEDGTLMAFNAAPGTIAPDEPGPYGVFGKSLAGAMREGGLPIDDVFAQVRLQVNQQTNGAVVPWSISKVAEPYSIFERAPDAPPSPALVAATEMAKRPLKAFSADEAYSVALQRDTLASYQDYLAAYPSSAQARRVRAILAARREAIFWRRSVDENSPRAYWTYLRAYPQGPHMPDARRRLRILAAQFAPPPDFAPVEYADLPPPPPDELIYDRGPTFVFDGPDFGPPPPRPPHAFVPVEDDDWRDLPPPPPPAGLGYLPVLSVAIPLLLGAKVVHDHNAAHAQQKVGAPPPLPGAFKPHDRVPAVVPQTGAEKPVAPGAGVANPVEPLESGKTPKAQTTTGEPLVVKPNGKPGPVLKPLPGQAEPLAPLDQSESGLKPLKPELGTGPKKDLKTAPSDSKSAPKTDLKGAPLDSEPATGLKPGHKDLKAAPLDSEPTTPAFKTAPQKEIKAAPHDSLPPTQELKPAHKDFKAAPRDSQPVTQDPKSGHNSFKGAPLETQPTLQPVKPTSQVSKPVLPEVKTAPVEHATPHIQQLAPPTPAAPKFAPAAPVSSPVPPQHFAPAPAAGAKPALCGHANMPPCPK